LFLNAIFENKSKNEEKTKHDVSKEHLLWHYQAFREGIVDICLRCNEKRFKDSWKLKLKLPDMHNFRAHYKENSSSNWYEVLNTLEENEQLFNDLLMEINIFSNQVQHALNNLQANDFKSLRYLTLLAQRNERLKYSSVYSDEQVKYVSAYIFQIMAGWSVVDGYYDSDPILSVIHKL